MLYAYLFVANLLSQQPYISAISFWLQGLFYYVYLLYCLASYRDRRELCFYCEYEMVQGALHCIFGFFMTESFCWGFLVTVGVVFFCLVLVRQAQKEDREEERLLKMEKAQYECSASKMKKDDDATTAEDEDSSSSAYLN